MKAPIVGIDPGTRNVGWCVLWDAATRPGFYVGPPKAFKGSVRTAYRDSDHQLEPLFKTGTWRYAGELSEMVGKVSDLAGAYQPELVVVEGFSHRPWLRRPITESPEMGRLIGMLEERLRHDGVRVHVAPADSTKAGMKAVRAWFRNDHEFSAYCAAQFGASPMVRRSLADT